MKQKKATMSEMQSNTKDKFEHSEGQGVGRMANGMPIKTNSTICLKHEVG
jgi:hypothetical protein